MFAEEENDSYRAATEGLAGPADDNLTATGRIKSYRKTPYVSKASDLDTVPSGHYATHSGAHYQDLASMPVDEHRLLLHELFARLVTDPQLGLAHPQVFFHLLHYVFSMYLLLCFTIGMDKS